MNKSDRREKVREDVSTYSLLWAEGLLSTKLIPRLSTSHFRFGTTPGASEVVFLALRTTSSGLGPSKAGIPKLAIALSRAREFSIRDRISIEFEGRGARAEAKEEGRARSVARGSIITKGIGAGVGMRSGMRMGATGTAEGVLRAAAEASIFS